MKGYEIRPLRASDFAALMRLEEEVYAAMLASSPHSRPSR